MDRDSPIEYTGEAHLVTVTCPCCDETHSVPETTADYKDGDVVCSDCNDKMDDLYNDLFIRNQAERLHTMAEFLRSRGFYTKAEMFDHIADELEKYEPVIRAVKSCRSGDHSFDREGLERAIEKYE